MVYLASSTYYVAKFDGLEDLYETGSTTIQLDQLDAGERLTRSRNHMNAADTLRLPLLHAAGRPVKQSREAYQKIRELLDGTAITVQNDAQLVY